MAYVPSEEAAHVTELRKSGQLREAYGYAKAVYQTGNCEETFMSAYTWVLHDCLKRYFDNSSRFHSDVRAFVQTLAQIRAFPIRRDRDELFIENLINKVRSVCWDLAKQGNLDSLRLLASEICRWRRGTVLYTVDIARPLLIGLKADYQGSGMILNWLNIGADSWATFLGLPPEAIGAQAEQDDVASEAVLWTLYDELKRHAGDDQGRGLSLERFVQTLSLFRYFDHSSSEAREVLAYAVGKLVHIGWGCRKAKNLRGVQYLLQEAVQWPQRSMMHTGDVLLMFSKGLLDDAASIIKLAEWYGPTEYSSMDYEEKKDGDKTYPSLAQSFTSQYLEALMAQDRGGQPIATVEQKLRAANELQTLLDSGRCQSWKWESYKLGLLLTDIGLFEQSRARLANIVASEPRQAWAWAAYGRAWKNDSEEMYEQCLFKGLSVSNDVQTALSVHEEALQVFAKEGMFGHARAEAELIESFRAEHEWKPSAVVEWAKSEEWYRQNEPSNDCAEAYKRLSKDAEDILADMLPWTEFYAEWEDRDKGIVGIVISAGYDKTNSLIANRELVHGSLADRLEVGRCYRGHCGPEKKAILGKVEEWPQAEISKFFLGNYSGLIDIIRDFGFVRGKPDNVWVSPALLKGLNAKQYQKVSGSCRRVFRKDKGWAWEASSIELGEDPVAESFERVFEGYLDVARKGFGFIDDCFVPASLVDLAGRRSYVRVKAKKSWDSKKNHWSWSAFELLDGEEDDWD